MVKMTESKLKVKINSALLTTSLKALGKHLSELASELEIINNTLCPECGDKLKPKKEPIKNRMVFCTCPRCEYAGFHKEEYFLASGGKVDNNTTIINTSYFCSINPDDVMKVINDRSKDITESIKSNYNTMQGSGGGQGA